MSSEKATAEPLSSRHTSDLEGDIEISSQQKNLENVVTSFSSDTNPLLHEDSERRSTRQKTLTLKAKENKITELSVKLAKLVNANQHAIDDLYSNIGSITDAEDLENIICGIEQAAESAKSVYEELCQISLNKIDTTIETKYSQYVEEIQLVKPVVFDKIQEIRNIHANEEEELQRMDSELKRMRAELEEENRIYEERKALRDRQRSQFISQRRIAKTRQDDSSSSAHAPRLQDASPLRTSHLPYSNIYETPTRPTAAALHMESPPTSMRSDDSNMSIKHLADCLANSIKTTKRNTIEPSIFKGNPLEFDDWQQDFDSFLESQGISSGAEKMRYLKNYISGDARACVEGQLMLKTDQSYSHARKKLSDRFGKKFDVARAMREKLDSWPVVRNSDSKGLQKFADYLDHCRIGVETMRELQILNSYQENEKLADKLPDWAARKWASKVRQIKNTEERYPSFAEFTSFVAEEADLLAEPLLMRRNKGAAKPMLEKNSRTSQLRTFATNNSVNRKCIYCSETTHWTAHCEKLAHKPYAYRKEFLWKNKLCFACLGEGHTSVACQNKQNCRKCKGNHPTCLHKRKEDWTNDGQAFEARKASTKSEGDTKNAHSHQTDSKEGATKLDSKATNTNTDEVLSMIFPVWISTKETPHRDMLIYALVDSQSDHSYITKEVANVLKPRGQKEKVTISTMTGESPPRVINKYKDLTVRGYTETTMLDLEAFEWDTITCNRTQIPHCDNVRKYPHLREHADKLHPLFNIPVGLLIGRICSDAFIPSEVIRATQSGQPFAQKTALGWFVLGAGDLEETSPQALSVHSTSAAISNMDENSTISQDDIQFLEILEQHTAKKDDGALEMPLPFKSRPSLPNNRVQAEKRLTGLKKKLNANSKLKTEYEKFMSDLINRGHAELAPRDHELGETWYIPHFAVTHPKKKKIRVVFDCSAKFQDVSLNDQLLQGPDMMNSLLGILCRFRMEPIAIACDVERMFYNFYVKEQDRDYLRFLWYDQDGHIAEYRMTVHLFGASSSPAVATYDLRTLAEENKEQFPEAANFVKRNFYVDDGITSVDSTSSAIKLIENSRQLCATGNLRLHKFICNEQSVMSSVPSTERSEDVDLFKDNLPTQRTLGLEWAVGADTLRFSGNVFTEKPQTRRGLLSVVSQLFDPLGLLSPFTLLGKNILQKVNATGLDWNDEIDAELQGPWKKWLNQLLALDSVYIPRCVKPPGCGEVQRIELHNFCDASSEGIGACSYLRLINRDGQVFVNLVLGKSRVVPSKGEVTIPRLELQGALLATQLSNILTRELDHKIDEQFFWCDSTIVLGYIANENKRFKVYVANRVREIRQKTNPTSWRHVPGDLNPADIASRGMDCHNLNKSIWFTGPQFLRSKEGLQHIIDQDKAIPRAVSEADKEVARVTVQHVKATAHSKHTDMYDKLSIYSNLRKLKSSIARLQLVAKERTWKTRELTPKDLETAEKHIVKITQQRHFEEELSAIRAKEKVSRRSKLAQLDPFLDQDGILRVGGRAHKSVTLTQAEKHPVILPKNSHLSELIIQHYHNKVHHQGKNFTTAAIRTNGFWILGLPGQVRRLLNKCVTCRRIRATPSSQKMGLLPKERLEPAPAFTNVGIDCFGPITVKDRRTELKRWGLLFTCMYSRAVHIELLESLTTDAFISSLRNFICLRGRVNTIFCDNGTNFIGARNELQQELDKMSGDLKDFFNRNMIEFKMNTPHASHQGGSWERQIRTVRSILSGLAIKFKGRMDTAALRTAFYEAMATMNSRPLTTDNLNNPLETVITPNHITTFKSGSITSPPSLFTDSDIYGRRMWRRAQQFADSFWQEWKRSYLKDITKRQKWAKQERNAKVGDVVTILDENLPRNDWKLGIIEDVTQGADGLVRKAVVRLANQHLDKNGIPTSLPSRLERPIQKLVIVIPVEEAA